MADESMLTVIVGAIVLIAGIIGIVSYSDSGDASESDFSLGNVFSGLTSPTGNLIKNMFSSESETVEFSARLLSLEHQQMTFKFREPVTSIILNYTIPNPSLIVNGMPLISEKNHVTINEFKGDLIVSDKISIDGKTTSISFNDVEINPETGVSITAENISVESIVLTGVVDKSFEFKNIYGVINISAESGDLIYNKKTGDMDIKSFNGNMQIEDGVILIQGTGILKADVLKSPGI